MTPASGQRDLVTCRACGATLGMLNRQHDLVTLRPGVPICFEPATLVIGVYCPNCGEYRVIKAPQRYEHNDAVLKSPRAPP